MARADREIDLMFTGSLELCRLIGELRRQADREEAAARAARREPARSLAMALYLATCEELARLESELDRRVCNGLYFGTLPV